MGWRASGWTVGHALLWAAVGAGGVFAAERWRGRVPTLADLADKASARMEELDLTPEQRAELGMIRSRWRDAVVAEEQGWQARVAAAAATADQQIERLLTPDQARCWRDRAVGIATK
ncbi:MAG: hypothetical protein EXS13_06570 [Planctomycetes bacterium]|nr:hypothetical protein [Planctomycetota bacterium]